MAARDALRKIPVLAECQVAPEICAQVIPRLYTYMEPCVKIFHGQGDDRHAQPEVCGLLSAIERTTIASIAERFGQSRRPLQGFRGWHAWDEESLRQALRRHVTTPLGQGDGVRGCDPAGLPKSGGASVGVARQWCGRLGKVDPCQVAMDLGDVSRQGHTLVDTRRDLPKAWTKAKARLAHAGVPNGSTGGDPRPRPRQPAGGAGG